MTTAIDFPTYRAMSLELKKGLPTDVEVGQQLKLISEHHDLINLFLFLVKKFCYKNKIECATKLKEYKQKESEWSELNLKKYYTTLTREEHMQFLRFILQEKDLQDINVEDIKVNWNVIRPRTSELKDSYLNGRHFYEVESMWKNTGVPKSL